MAEDSVRFDDRMSDGDALMWNIERDPLLRSTITVVWLLDRAPDRARLERKIGRATRAIPRLRQRVLPNPLALAPPRWQLDPFFDLAAHVGWHKAPGDGSLRALLDFAQPIAMRHFDTARPLWELAVVEGLQGAPGSSERHSRVPRSEAQPSEATSGGRGALVLKLHHSISDGMGLVRMTQALVERTREGAGTEKEAPEAPEGREWSQLELARDELAHEWRRQLGRLSRLGGGLAGALRSPLDSAAALRRSLGSLRRGLAPTGEPLSPLLRGRSLSCRFDPLSVPLAELRAAGKKADGTLNDAFVAAVCGGLRLYHEASGAPVDELRMTMPVNIRDGDDADKAGNQFAPARFAVPIATPDPVERMRAIGSLVRRERAEPVLGFLEGVAGVLNRLPTSLSVSLFGSMLKGIDFVTSNVPGPRREVFTAGAKMDAVYGFGPLSGAAINATLFSYAGTCFVALNSDPAAVPDPLLLRECLEAGFAEVVGVA
jgi:WS/DGAT/MGAT family acyltransferase